MTDRPFRQRVYEIARLIPLGKVVTYGQLAELAGSPKAARAVGVCMKENPDNTIIPCHRVVASDGSLIAFAFGGVAAKKAKLLSEGVSFRNERVELSVSQWEPSKEERSRMLSLCL